MKNVGYSAGNSYSHPFFLFWGQLKVYFPLKWAILKTKIVTEEIENIEMSIVLLYSSFSLLQNTVLLTLDLTVPTMWGQICLSG